MLLLGVGCSRQPGPDGGPPAPAVVPLAGETMGTTYSIRYVGDAARAVETKRQVDELLDAVNGRYSTYREDSTISRFNVSRSAEPFEVGAEFVSVLRSALDIAARTGGTYDPSVLPLVRLYGFGPGGRREAPSAAQIAEAHRHVDFRRLQIIDATRIRKTDPDLEIDLSSIAKGAGVDRVSELLTRLGLPAHMVEIGGEVVCRGTKPDGEPWRIGVERPPRDDSEAATRRPIEDVVELRDRALATSGSYRNYFESGGMRIHHVLDARTGVNAPNGVVSVSVDAPDCTLADGLATALMLLGPDASAPLLAAYPESDLKVLFLIADGAGGVREVRLRWPEPR